MYQYRSSQCVLCAFFELQFDLYLQLATDVRCIVTFTNTLCVIQNQHLRTLIGLGARRDELYYFHDIPRICALPNTGYSSYLWHQRSGILQIK